MEVTFDDVCSMLKHKIQISAGQIVTIVQTIQHVQDIHKSQLHTHVAVNGQNVCVKVYFIGWPEEFLGDGKNNENHHGPYHFTTA